VARAPSGTVAAPNFAAPRARRHLGGAPSATPRDPGFVAHRRSAIGVGAPPARARAFTARARLRALVRAAGFAFPVARRAGDVGVVVGDAYALIVIGAAIGHRGARGGAGHEPQRFGGRRRGRHGEPGTRSRDRPCARSGWGDVFGHGHRDGCRNRRGSGGVRSLRPIGRGARSRTAREKRDRRAPPELRATIHWACSEIRA